MKKLSVLLCALFMVAGTAFAQDANSTSSTETVKVVSVNQGDAVEASTSTEVTMTRDDVKAVPAAAAASAKKACCASKASAAKSGSGCTAAQKAACTPEQKAACASQKKAACGAKAAAAPKEDTPNP